MSFSQSSVNHNMTTYNCSRDRRIHFGPATLSPILVHKPRPSVSQRFVRTTKNDSLVDRADLIDSNQSFACFRYQEGERINCVSSRLGLRSPLLWNILMSADFSADLCEDSFRTSICWTANYTKRVSSEPRKLLQPAYKNKQIGLLVRSRKITSGYGRKWQSPFSTLNGRYS